MRRSSVHYFAAAVHTFIATCIYITSLHTSALLHYAGAIRAFVYAASQWKCGLAL